MTRFSIMLRIMAGGLCIYAGTCLAAEKMEEQTVVKVGLDKLVQKVAERNTTMISDFLNVDIARAKAEAEEGIFEPVFHSSVNYRSDDYPNTTEDALIREEDDYSEEAFEAGIGLKKLFSTGATWDLSFVDKRRTSSTIEKFRDYKYENGNSLKLSLEQPLLRDFGKSATLAKIQAARIQSEIEKKKFDQKLMELVGAAIRQYWTLYGTQEIYRSWEKSLQIAQDFLKDYQRRASGGKIAETALMEARCGIGLRKAKVYNAQNKVSRARNQLLTLLNVSSADCRGIKLVAAEKPAKNRQVIADPGRYIEMAYKNWPEYLIAKKRIEKEQIQVRHARNQMLPRLDFVGNTALNSLDRDSDEALQAIGDGDYVSWFVGVKLELPIYGNNTAQSDLRRARLRKQQAAFELEALQTGLANVIMDRIEQVNLFRGQVEEYEKVWALRSKLLDIERSKLEYGRSSLTDLLKQEEDYIEYQRQLLNAIMNYKLSQAELHMAVGNILTQYGISREDIDLWIQKGVKKDRGQFNACVDLKKWF